MKKQRSRLISGMIAFVLLAMGIPWATGAEKNILPVAIKQAPVSNAFLKESAFTGALACKECHAKEYEAWSQSWHSRMLRKISPDIVVADFNNVEITYPDVEVLDAAKQKVKIAPVIRLKREGDDFKLVLVDKDNAANNQAYSMSYVLGGHWEQQFEVAVGSTFYPSPMRWVTEDKQWRDKAFSEIWWVADGTPDGRPRKPEEMQPSQVSDAKCDGCHTAGLKTVKEGNSWKLPERDKGLAIGCEKCHGAGSRHVAAKTRESILNPAKLNVVQQNQLCGQCHSRVTSKSEPDLAYPLNYVPGDTNLQNLVEFWTYSTKTGNFWPNEYANKNRQQYHDVQKTGHTRGGVTCITCHSGHTMTRVAAQLRLAADGTCKKCHTDAARMFEESPMAKAGVTCASCHMAKIANRAGSTQKNKEHWDVSSHAFDVVMPYVAESYKMPSSCDACHAGDEKAYYGELMLNRQNAVLEKIHALKMIPEKSASPAASLNVRAGMTAVLLDGSLGVHNYEKAIELLSPSIKKGAGAWKSSGAQTGKKR